MSFINKVILVTGAGSGIGEAVCLHFAKLSARLSLVDKDAANLKKCADECERISRVKVFTTVSDLRKDEHVKKVIDDTKKEFGRIDVVINCAGVYKPVDIFDPNLIEVFDDVITTNLRSVVCMTNCVAPILAETKGNIINISTCIYGAAKSIAYKTTVAALNHFTACIALELALSGIRVNSISPGIKPNIFNNAEVDKGESEAFWCADFTTPLGRIVKSEDIAEFAVFLASDKARAMTGCSYSIDAGLTL